MNVPHFNIRVYGLWTDADRGVLVTDEFRNGRRMTKFPGGGLEFNEGILDCLKREWIEELSVEIQVDKLFYLNDFLQKSAFNPNGQLISIYYTVQPLAAPKVPISSHAFDWPHDIEGAQSFRWMPFEALLPEALTFPVDRVVAEMLRHDYRANPPA